MRVSRNNLLFIAIFAGVIILPTAILSVLSFRNIQNENFLAQKKFSENQISLQKEIETTIAKEQEKIFQETKTASLFLYESPKSLLEFDNATTFKDVKGIEAIFLYNNGNLIYPDISSRSVYSNENFSTAIASSVEKKLFQAEQDSNNWEILSLKRTSLARNFFNPQSLSERVQNLLSLTRIAYQRKQYELAESYLKILEKVPHLQGYLHNDLTRSINLLHFEILVKQKKHTEAENYCLAILEQFLKSTYIEDIASTRFFFENAFTQILSFENLSQERREAFWNLRENFNRQLSYLDVLSKYKKQFQELLMANVPSKDGILFKNEDDLTVFKMTYPLLSGNQIVIAKIDNDAYKKRILDKLKNIDQRWKNIPFSITGINDTLLLGSIPDSTNVLFQIHLQSAEPWELTFYEKNIQEIKKETQHKMFLMYGLLLFSLITVVFGSFFMFRFIIQERKLLAMKTNFLSSVSHELKTPLTSIKMFSEMMARGRVIKVEKIQEYSILIGKEASRLENLIGAILNYTRMEHGTGAFKWEKLDFSICAKKVFEAIEDIGVEKGLTFSTRFEPNVYVMGDYTALYSLAQNLIENAIKYTNAPGNIDVKVYNDEGQAVFSVIDTGIGIASSEQKNIFNDFYRVGDEMTRSTKGSGLGLAIVKKVVETHRATISLISKPGKGSNFTIRFRKVE